MKPDTDMLIERARKGDMDAFSALFETMRPMAFSIACRLVGPTDADDIVMNTYLKAWKAMPRFKGRSSLKTWTYRIVHNCALDFIRSRKRIKEVPFPGGDEMDMPDSAQTIPDEAAALSDDASHLHTALGFLSNDHRTALLLRFSDGLSYAEIAAATGVSTGTVMSRLFNAKRKLRKVLESSDNNAILHGAYKNG